jgi:hypothetical protein
MSFSQLFNSSVPEVPPSHFMPWHVGVRAESPLFFSRTISDGAGLRQGFQPRIRGGRSPLPGMPLFNGDMRGFQDFSCLTRMRRTTLSASLCTFAGTR